MSPDTGTPDWRRRSKSSPPDQMRMGPLYQMRMGKRTWRWATAAAEAGARSMSSGAVDYRVHHLKPLESAESVLEKEMRESGGRGATTNRSGQARRAPT